MQVDGAALDAAGAALDLAGSEQGAVRQQVVAPSGSIPCTPWGMYNVRGPLSRAPASSLTWQARQSASPVVVRNL